MKITLLGTGDTIGAPKIGCDCEVCSLLKAENRERLRTSMLIENEGKRILIDTSPDLRRQLLSNGSPAIDYVVWTHAHYDHIAGYNEFYRVQKFPPAYAAPEVMEDIKKFFYYLRFEKNPVPAYESFVLAGIRFTLVEVNHPPIFTCGVVMEYNGKKIGYTSDTNPLLNERTTELLSDCDLLFLDSLMPPDVHIGKHMNYAEATEFAKAVRAKEFHLVHMSHRIGDDLPHVSHDGDVFEF
ncbi:MBL fold metallo-hydrolase [Methanoplanus sp. FWC-SCC4]|uniref:MBL fold metallo-hydrolase n=1 Tax=Methanochimaera problematica TaxID=2609417 RepID=A0AA97FC14_9EURY|nr:MBL fold metallo-hydrolase [Methanoplanus sp. FWC-SCC4]WOF16690.1 MBL fold metallo-hydrolase [Methanoplanus sp. FWC-SCC4]